MTTSPPPVLFPAFLYGDRQTVRRKMKAEAKKWAKRHADKRDFPEPALAPVPPGSIMIWNEDALHVMLMSDSTANDPEWAKVAVTAGPKAPRWHFYMVDTLRIEISEVLQHNKAGFDEYREAFEAFVCRYPWGALAVAIKHLLYNTIPLVTRRIEAVLSFWEQLDTLRYMHLLRPVSLTEMIAFEFRGDVAMWVDQPTGNIRTDLRVAIDRMRQASEDEIQTRLMRRLYALADSRRDLNHREWLKTPGVIERRMTEIGRECVEDLHTGNIAVLGGFLARLDRRYPDG